MQRILGIWKYFTNVLQVWWTKNGQKLSERSSRIRQIHNHYKQHEYRLKIRNVRQQDFGEYECNVYVNDTRLQRSATLNVTGK